MAIEKTTTVQEVRVRPAMATGDATLRKTKKKIELQKKMLKRKRENLKSQLFKKNKKKV